MKTLSYLPTGICKSIFGLLTCLVLLSFLAPGGVSAQAWNFLNSPTTAQLRQIQFVDANTGIVSAFGQAHQTWLTADGGLTWTDISANNVALRQEGIEMAGPDTLISYGLETATGAPAYYLSPDQGQTWNAITPPTFTGNAAPMIVLSGSSFYVSNQIGWVYKTVDAGQTWTTVQNAIAIGGVKAGGGAGDDLYFLVDYSIPQTFISKVMALLSNDAGASWDTIEVSRYIYMTGMDIIAPNTVYFMASDSIFETTDAGATWNLYQTGITQANPFTQGIDFASPTEGYLATTYSIYRNDGTGTFALDFTDTNTVFRDVSIGGIYAYACGDDGLLMKRDGLDSRSEVLPLENVKVYPNPVKNKLTVEVENQLDFTLLDGMGKTVQTGQLSPGKNRLCLKKLPAGTYFLQMQGTDRAGTEKIQVFR